MKPDRSNYEAWLLDRSEGALSPEQERMLDDFLSANPDLRPGAGELPHVSAAGDGIDWKHELRKELPPTGSPDQARLDDFLVARMEGGLDPTQFKELEKFLYEHPEHERSSRLMQAARVEGDGYSFIEKASIARHFPPTGLPDAHRLNDFLIAAVEGDLDRQQHSALSVLLAASPTAQKEERLVKAARVVAVPVIFENKELLKKREARVIMLWQRMAVAASVAMLIGAAWWLMRADAETKLANERKELPQQRINPAPQQAQEVVAPSSEGTVPVSIGDTTTEQHRPPYHEQDGRRQQVPALPVAPKEQIQETLPEPPPELALEDGPAEIEHQPGVPHTENLPSEQHDATAPVHTTTGVVKRSDDLPTLLANTVRTGVLEADQRPAALDRTDALAAVDKGLRTVTGGKGGIKVDNTGKRKRLNVRFGKSLSISASRGN